MNHKARAGILLVIVIVLALAGCSREQSDWRSAKDADTIEAYDQFIAKHPDGELATQARARSAQLGEDRDWQRVAKADTLEGYQQFVTQHPNGKWTQEARVRIENFAIAGEPPATTPVPPGAAPGAAPAPGPTAAAKPAPARSPAPAPLAAAAQPKPAKVAAAAAKPAARTKPIAGAKSAASHASGAHHTVQLGAFRSQQKADAEWTRLKRTYAQDLGALKSRVAPASSKGGTIYRLQALVSDEAQARALCARLKAHRQGCILAH